MGRCHRAVSGSMARMGLVHSAPPTKDTVPPPPHIPCWGGKVVQGNSWPQGKQTVELPWPSYKPPLVTWPLSQPKKETEASLSPEGETAGRGQAWGGGTLF